MRGIFPLFIGVRKMAEEYEFRVETWNEDGWTEGHEEEDITDDIEIAIIWLEREDCVYGSIYLNGKMIATKDKDSEIEVFDGWTRNGKKVVE